MTLNEVIKDIQEKYQLSAEARNALHGATFGHPWCGDKSLETRKLEALFATVDRVSSRDADLIRKARS